MHTLILASVGALHTLLVWIILIEVFYLGACGAAGTISASALGAYTGMQADGCAYNFAVFGGGI